VPFAPSTEACQFCNFVYDTQTIRNYPTTCIRLVLILQSVFSASVIKMSGTLSGWLTPWRAPSISKAASIRLSMSLLTTRWEQAPVCVLNPCSRTRVRIPTRPPARPPRMLRRNPMPSQWRQTNPRANPSSQAQDPHVDFR